MYSWSHNWNKIGLSFLANKHGDLSLLLYFSKQILAGNIEGKIKKKLVT